MLTQRRAMDTLIAGHAPGVDAGAVAQLAGKSWFSTSAAKLKYVDDDDAEQEMDVGRKTEAWLCPDDIVLGSIPLDEERRGIYDVERLRQASGKSLIACHLLNHDLGGAGVQENMFPHTTEYNAAHSKQQEDHTKAKLHQVHELAEGAPDGTSVGLRVSVEVDPMPSDAVSSVADLAPVRFKMTSTIADDKGAEVDNPQAGRVEPVAVHPRWNHRTVTNKEWLTASGAVATKTYRARNEAFRKRVTDRSTTLLPQGSASSSSASMPLPSSASPLATTPTATPVLSSSNPLSSSPPLSSSIAPTTSTTVLPDSILADDSSALLSPIVSTGEPISLPLATTGSSSSSLSLPRVADDEDPEAIRHDEEFYFEHLLSLIGEIKKIPEAYRSKFAKQLGKVDLFSNEFEPGLLALNRAIARDHVTVGRGSDERSKRSKTRVPIDQDRPDRSGPSSAAAMPLTLSPPSDVPTTTSSSTAASTDTGF
ncbi:hypothetical protein CDN99_21720 [Roseateles aquatilis]|uniref:Uncharacterized protein n=2 Tax=Roseateles aquatilis TaxID=431061 RepID=A0A246IZC8_9BURK|nr:hypothetical protein CDN99_21720 [Roseateles aquatilis]